MKVKDKLKKGFTIIRTYLKKNTMKIIDFSSNLNAGEFICRFTFEDDTDVFYTSEGWECVNFNNIKEDLFYIELAQKYYTELYK